MDDKEKTSFLRDTRGVSVMFATLLLILITIVAASGVAFMVSTMQKEAMDRESYQSAVKSENLKIVSIKPSGNGSQWQSINMTVLNLNTANSYISSIRINDGYFFNFKALDENGLYETYKGYPAVYSAKRMIMIPAMKPRTIHLNFTDISVTGSEIVSTAGWSNNSTDFTYQLKMHPWKAYYGEKFSCRVFNTSDSMEYDMLNNCTISNEDQTITIFGSDAGGSMSNTTSYELIYNVDFKSHIGPAPLEKDPLQVEIITSYINLFNGLFTPPMPIANVQFKVEQLQTANGTQYPRSYVILDASGSMDKDGGSITNYRWAIWNDNGNESLYDYNLSGMVVRPMIDPYVHRNVIIDLMVTDDSGMHSKLSQVSGNLTLPL